MSGRALAYVRQSSARPGEDEETSLSLTSQEARIQSYAAREGWQIVETIRDHDISGERADRPGLQKLMERVKRGDIQYVVVFALSRLSRKVGQLFFVVESLEEQGVTLVSTTEAGIDNVLVRAVHGGMAEHSNVQLRQHIRSNLETRAKRGLHHGPAPLGYRVAGDRSTGKRLDLEPDEAATVQRIYRMRADGVGVPTIAETLNAEGIPTRYGRPWHHNSVRVILRTPTYAGYAVYRGEIVGDLAPGVAEPIIDRALWHQVQRMFTGRRSVKANKEQGSWLEGLVRHSCGTGMGLQRSHQRQVVFRCNRFSTSSAFRCRQPPNQIAQAGLERAAWECLLTDLSTRELDPAALVRARAEALGQPDAVKRRAALIKQKTKLLDALKRAEKLVTDQGIRDGAWLKDYEAEMKPRLAAVDAELETLIALPTESDMAKMVTDIGKMVPDVAALRYSDAAMRATLALLGQVVFDGTVRIAYAPEYRDAFPHPTVIRPVYTRAAFGEVGTWRLERVTD
jgi:DNA invertase Pin-like site-specific DNA recombinase